MVAASRVRRRDAAGVARVGYALVLIALLAAPADRVAGTSGGPLFDRLAAVEASPAARTETVVDRFAPLGVELVDQTRSLAGDSDIAAVADAFDAVGVDTAAFSTDISRFHDERGTLLPYRAIAVGTGSRSDGTILAVAFAQADDASADAQRGRLDAMVRTGTDLQARRPWSDLLSVERIEVRGRVVVAILPTTLASLWLDLERNPDTLLWWS